MSGLGGAGRRAGERQRAVLFRAAAPLGRSFSAEQGRRAVLDAWRHGCNHGPRSRPEGRRGRPPRSPRTTHRRQRVAHGFGPIADAREPRVDQAWRLSVDRRAEGRAASGGAAGGALLLGGSEARARALAPTAPPPPLPMFTIISSRCTSLGVWVAEALSRERGAAGRGVWGGRAATMGGAART